MTEAHERWDTARKLIDLVADAVYEAVLAEREACAKLAEATAVRGPISRLSDLQPDWPGTLLKLASAIRARGKETV